LTPQELSVRSDADIDFSDIPELDENFWTNAVLTPPSTKKNVSLRISKDVLAFFKSETPKGYTARMALVLKAYVDAQQVNKTNNF
jgi:uncharacterized protein (DUF4415 family)